MASDNLGDFSRLPAELRIEIWKHLRPCSGPVPTFASGGLGILRACRQLNTEATYYLYENERLNFHVGPVHGSWLSIENDHGAVWKIEDARDGFVERFANLPYWKLGKICILIHARKHTDDQELCFLLKHVYDLVDLLLQVNKFPAIEIAFVDTGYGSWCDQDGEPWRHTGNGRIFRHQFDYREVLWPFGQLRNIPKASIDGLGLILRDVHRDAPSFIEQVMEWSQPFGVEAIGDDACEIMRIDEFLKEEMGRTYTAIERAIDQLHGPGMCRVRLERFMYWYDDKGNSPYLEKWRRFCPENLERDADVVRRHNWLIAYNPLSGSMQRMRLQMDVLPFNKAWRWHSKDWFNPDECKSYLSFAEKHRKNGSASKDEAGNPEMDLKSYWSKEEWRRYHCGGIYAVDLDDPWSIVQQMREINRHEEGFSEEEKPKGFDRIKTQASLINFAAPEEEVRAVMEVLTTGPRPEYVCANNEPAEDQVDFLKAFQL